MAFEMLKLLLVALASLPPRLLRVRPIESKTLFGNRFWLNGILLRRNGTLSVPRKIYSKLASVRRNSSKIWHYGCAAGHRLNVRQFST